MPDTPRPEAETVGQCTECGCYWPEPHADWCGTLEGEGETEPVAPLGAERPDGLELPDEPGLWFDGTGKGWLIAMYYPGADLWGRTLNSESREADKVREDHLPPGGWRKAVPEGERDLELLTALAEDDGINFHPPLAGERGTVEIRQDARDNADWDEFPCDWKRLDNGWSVPIVTAEIRAAVRRALENRLDYERPSLSASRLQSEADALGWMPLPPAPGRGA
jgi:hypothetical protein